MVTIPAIPLTKIQPPRLRSNLIARAELERCLGDALASCRLTLLIAPAGFGKTSALTRQLHLLPETTAVAWIGADEGDDLHRFLLCLFTAFEPFDLPWRTAPDALITAAVNAPDDRRHVAADLINALAASDTPRGLILMEDAHRITDPAVFEFIDLLLERLPDQWGMVISSRVEPPLAIARLRGRGEIVEVGHTTLRFDVKEVAALVDASGCQVDPSQLLTHTGGWAAGLRLSLNATTQGQPPLGSALTTDRHVFEYVAVEILDRMPAQLRDLLLSCAVLPELTAARCAAMTGNSQAQILFDEIDRRGLFVAAVEASEPTLRLHDLFRDCLLEVLRRENPGALPNLLVRAAATEPDPIRRLTFLLRAETWEEAENLLEEVAAGLLAAGSIEPVLRLVDQFPVAHRERSPTLALVRGEALWAMWDWWGAAQAMRRACQGFAEANDPLHWHRAQLFEAIALDGNGLVAESKARLAELAWDEIEPETRSLALALRTWHAIDSGDFRAVASCYESVLDVLEQVDRLEYWYRCFQRPLYVLLPGMSAPLVRFVDGVMRRTGESPSQMRAIAYVMAAWLALSRGDLAQASAQVALAQSDARWLGLPTRLHFFVNTVSAAVNAIRGERESALAAVDTLLHYFDTAPVSGSPAQPTSMYAHYLFYGARLADTLGDGATLRAYAARLPAPREIKNFEMLSAPLSTVAARLAALDGRHEEACALWQNALADEGAIDVIGLAQESRLRYAWALLALGEHAAAAKILEPALHTAATTGEIGGILFAGRRVLACLAAAPWGDTLDSRSREVLQSWAARLDATGAAIKPLAVAWGEPPLSPRELQVLERMASGDSNKLIARAFDLSPHTVKRHVANILDKLGVNSRRDAARWYQDRH